MKKMMLGTALAVAFLIWVLVVGGPLVTAVRR